MGKEHAVQHVLLCAFASVAIGCVGTALEDVAHPARAPVCAFAGPDAPRHLFAGDSSVCALVGVERDLWCWGSNADGSMHLGTSYVYRGDIDAPADCRPEEEQELHRQEVARRRRYSEEHPEFSCIRWSPFEYEPVPCSLRPFDTRRILRDLSFGAVNCGVTTFDDASCWGLHRLAGGEWKLEATELHGAQRVVAAGFDGKGPIYGLFAGGKVKCGATPEAASSAELCAEKVNALSSLKSRVVQLESDRWSVCAVTEDQRLICSGEWPTRTGCASYSGRCHMVSAELRKLRVRRVAMGGGRRCAQTPDDEVLCWGHYGDSELATDAMLLPEPVPGLPRVATIAGGYGHACAIAHDGQVYCWGKITSADKPDLEPPNPIENRAQKIEGLPPLCELAGGHGHMCGVATDGSVYCWGKNPSGQLGDGTRDDSLHRAVQTLPPGSVVLNAP